MFFSRSRKYIFESNIFFLGSDLVSLGWIIFIYKGLFNLIFCDDDDFESVNCFFG